MDGPDEPSSNSLTSLFIKTPEPLELVDSKNKLLVGDVKQNKNRI